MKRKNREVLPWKDALRRHVVTFGFTLHLSKSMLEFLCAVADDVEWDRRWVSFIHIPDNWLSTSVSLERRGLIRRKPPKVVAEIPTGSRKSFWMLTPAGKHVVELVKMAGVFVEAVASITKQLKEAQ